VNLSCLYSASASYQQFDNIWNICTTSLNNSQSSIQLFNVSLHECSNVVLHIYRTAFSFQFHCNMKLEPLLASLKYSERRQVCAFGNTNSSVIVYLCMCLLLFPYRCFPDSPFVFQRISMRFSVIDTSTLPFSSICCSPNTVKFLFLYVSFPLCVFPSYK